MMTLAADWIVPDWPAPATVRSLVTTRGDSAAPFGEFNLALHVADDSRRVQANRDELQRLLAVNQLQWLQQVHGTSVVSLPCSMAVTPEADALYSSIPGSALAVLTADCLPVLLCDRQGSEIAVAHAGWRGLAAGILNNTLASFQQPAGQLMAWLGPAISQAHFEVGGEVRQAFLASPVFMNLPGTADAFIPSDRLGHYYCDLYELARLSLRGAGVRDIYGGDYCTYGDPQRFYSFRREPVCGRMATLIMLQKR